MARRSTKPISSDAPNARLEMTHCTSEGPVLRGSLALVQKFCSAMDWQIGDYSTTRLVTTSDGRQILAISSQDDFALALARDTTGRIRAYLLNRDANAGVDLMLVAR